MSFAFISLKFPLPRIPNKWLSANKYVEFNVLSTLFVKYKSFACAFNVLTSIVTLYSLFPKRLFDETVNSLAVKW